MEYYYSSDGNSWSGPVSAQELKELARKGVITPMYQVMVPDRIPPTPAHKAKGLFSTDPAPSATENAVVDAQTKSIFGSAFSMVSGAVSSVTTAIVPAKPQEVVAADPPAMPAPIVAAQASCPVQVADDEIGPFVLHAAGGTQIKGEIDAKLNPVIPGGLRPGWVELFIHQAGIRIEQKKIYPLLFKYSDLKAVKPLKHKELRSLSGSSTLQAAATGFFIAGPLGALLATMGSQQEWEISKDFVYLEDANGVQLLIGTTEKSAKRFADRIKEQCVTRKTWW